MLRRSSGKPPGSQGPRSLGGVLLGLWCMLAIVVPHFYKSVLDSGVPAITALSLNVIVYLCIAKYGGCLSVTVMAIHGNMCRKD